MAAGLVPAIHAFIQRRKQEVDARDKPGMTEETGALGCGLISTQPKTIKDHETLSALSQLNATDRR